MLARRGGRDLDLLNSLGHDRGSDGGVGIGGFRGSHGPGLEGDGSHQGQQRQRLVIGPAEGNQVVGHPFLQRGIGLQGNGHVLPPRSHLERVVPGIEDHVIGGVTDVDPLEEVLFIAADADVEGTGVRVLNPFSP